MPDRTIHQVQCHGGIALAKGGDAGKVQGIPLIRFCAKDVIEQRLRIGEPASALVFVGEAEGLGGLQRHCARREHAATASPSVARVAEALNERAKDRQHRFKLRAIVPVAIH